MKRTKYLLIIIIALATAACAAQNSSRSAFNSQMRQGLAAELQNDFNEALTIYRNIIDDPNADKKYKAQACCQAGVCFLKMGDKEKAIAQFESCLSNYPLETGALKSMEILRNIRAGQTDKKIQEQKQTPIVVDAIPAPYLENADPNIRAIKIIFSEPMKKTDWFYCSYAEALMPQSTAPPSFDGAGLEWTLPVKLEPGKVYAIAVNYLETENKNPAGFRSISGQRCDSFILVFATIDEEGKPTPIDGKIIEKSDKINFGQ
jgi:tetratricopeptide (TPR) repeat protein